MAFPRVNAIYAEHFVAEFARVSCDGDAFCACDRAAYETFVRELPPSASGLLAGP